MCNRDYKKKYFVVLITIFQLAFVYNATGIQNSMDPFLTPVVYTVLDKESMTGLVTDFPKSFYEKEIVSLRGFMSEVVDRPRFFWMQVYDNKIFVKSFALPKSETLSEMLPNTPMELTVKLDEKNRESPIKRVVSAKRLHDVPAPNDFDNSAGSVCGEFKEYLTTIDLNHFKNLTSANQNDRFDQFKKQWVDINLNSLQYHWVNDTVGVDYEMDLLVVNCIHRFYLKNLLYHNFGYYLIYNYRLKEFSKIIVVYYPWYYLE